MPETGALPAVTSPPPAIISPSSAASSAAVVDFVREHPTRMVLPGSDGAIAALAAARELGIECPKTMRFGCASDLPAVLAEFSFLFVLKPSTSWDRQSASRLQATEVIDEAEAVRVTTTFFRSGVGVLAQEWAGGRREGVTLFITDGEVRAGFAHLEHRTTPALGGASVLRESVPMPADIYDLSVRLATRWGCRGCARSSSAGMRATTRC